MFWGNPLTVFKLVWSRHPAVARRRFSTTKTTKSNRKVINLRQNNKTFRFHPAEISKLESTQEGRDVLGRNGFQVIDIETGYRSLMAFKTLVGTKN